MTIWGIYSDVHPEVDLGGNRASLLELAELITRGRAGDLVLANAPPKWTEGTRPLRAVRLAPAIDPTLRIRFRRDGPILLISGQQSELARIVAGAISDLAELAGSTDAAVSRHVHFDPTSDPDQRFYSPESISIVVSLTHSA